MFGIFNLTREDTENDTRGKVKEKENNDEPCYGGFRSRWSYEDCCKKHSPLRRAIREANRTNAALFLLVCVFCGLGALSGGIIIYDFVQQNKITYHPSDSSEIPDEIMIPSPAAQAIPEKSESPFTAFIGVGTNEAKISLESVTEELSKLYRIPRGVLIRIDAAQSDTGSHFFLSGDIIVAVNGVEIMDVDSLDAQASVLTSDEGFTLKVFRKNKYIDFVVD